MRLCRRKERPIAYARRTIYQIIQCIISAAQPEQLREREKNPRTHTHKVRANLRARVRESEKCQLQLHAKSSALTLSFPTHYIHPAANRKSLARKGKVARRTLSLFRAPTTFVLRRPESESANPSLSGALSSGQKSRLRGRDKLPA